RPTLPIAGQFSLSWLILATSIIAPFILFQLGYSHHLKLHLGENIASWRKRLHSYTLSTAHTIVYTGITLLLIALINNAFKGLQFDILTASIIIAVTSAIIAYT